MWTFQYKHGDRPLDGFTIQRAAGRGGFGEVYYAVSDSGREVALKVVQGYEQIELRGISQCMNLKSPHLVTIFDVKYNDQNRPFVIMEYVAGPSLRQLLDDSPSGLGEQKAAFFLREIAKGLTFLHDCGIVHRDLKPGNIFYENGYVKIGDYGLSKAISTSQHSGQTVTVGTVHYMAPEIGAGKYDRSIDIYALGACLYEMLTGTVPFVGASPSEILLKHLSAEPDCSGIPEPFAATIKRAMAKDPSRRFQSVQEMVESVFGAAHVQQSVSVFSPQELSVVAAKAAKAIAVGAGVGGSRGAGSDRKDPWAKVGSWMDGVGGQMRHALHDKNRVGAFFDEPQTANDPLTTRHRWQLALFVSILAPIAATLLISRRFAPPATSVMFIFLSTWGLAIGVVGARRWLLTRATAESPVVRRLVIGQAAALLAIIFSLPTWGLINSADLNGTIAAIALPMFILDMRRCLGLNRAERVSVKYIFGAAFIGFVLAKIFHGNGLPAFAALAGASLIVQILSPWDRSAATVEGATPNSEDPTTPSVENIADSATLAQGPSGTPAPLVSATTRSVPVWRFVPLAWVFAAVAALAAGLMLLIAVGSSSVNSSDEAAMTGVGVSMLVACAVFLAQSFRRKFTGVWCYLIRPLIMLACAASILISAIVLGNSSDLNKDDEMLGAFFIIFPSLVFLLSIFLPLWLPGPAPAPTSMGGVSPHKRMWASLLTLLALFGVAGVHRFYVGKIWTGVLWFFTWGLCGVGQLIDLVQILGGNFRDKQGRTLMRWDNEPVALAPPATPAPIVPLPIAPGGVAPGALPRVAAFAVALPRAAGQAGRAALAGRSPVAGLFAFVGSIFLFAALAVSVGLAVKVPEMFARGLPDPEIAKSLEHDVFRSTDWPGLMHRAGGAAATLLAVLAAAMFLLARRRFGVGHMLRGVLGTGVLLYACASLSRAFAGAGVWSDIAASVHQKQQGLAVDMFLRGWNSSGVMTAAIVFLMGVGLLAWPPKRTAPRLNIESPQRA
ncbi:MAG: protein kinase domain-containing protein [Tepidisphaeraceae bacterium]